MPELVPHLPLAEEPLLLDELNHRISSEFASLIALCRSISRSKFDPMKIELVLAAPPLLLESGRCRRLGVIVSELITNAARHAFAGRPGRIRVEMLRAGGLVKCIASD